MVIPMNDISTLRGTPDDAQSPQASASTNSAIRATYSVVDGISQENGVPSRGQGESRSDTQTAAPLEITEEKAGELNRRAAATERRFWAALARSSGCWLWTKAVSKSGYGSTNYLGESWQAHRLAYHLTHGRDLPERLPPRVQVRHSCDVKLCCNPAHLSIGSAQDNSNDAMARGRTNGGKPKGVSHRGAKARIFELADAGVPKSEIATRLGMTERNVFYHLARRLSGGDVKL